MPAIAPVVNHSLLERVANTLDPNRRGIPEDAAVASSLDLAVFVAAMVCGGTTLRLDPTVPVETRASLKSALKGLDVEVNWDRAPDARLIASDAMTAATFMRGNG